MTGNTGNLGETNPVKRRKPDRVNHARGLLRIWPLGLMLASSPAYASTQYTHVVSDVVSDSVIDWGIGIFVIIIAMFIGFIVYDAKKNGRYE